MGGVYEELNFDEKRYYDKFYKAMVDGQSKVMALGIFKVEKIEKILNAINYDHVELFYIDFQRINCDIMPMGILYYIYYTVRGGAREALIKNMEEWISDVLHLMKLRGNESAAIIYRMVHNYLIRNIEYDYKALKNPNAYPEAHTVRGVFEQKKAACEGISKAFKLLCNRAGVKDVFIVKGTSSCEGFGNSLPHAWNIVKAGNEYFHIDVTWDINASGASRYNRYDYFMISDEWMIADHKFESEFSCCSNSETYFVRNRCLLEGINSLQTFIEQELQKKSPVLYFKIIGNSILPDDIDNMVKRSVEKRIHQYVECEYSIRMLPNREQNIYFYRINYRRIGCE